MDQLHWSSFDDPRLGFSWSYSPTAPRLCWYHIWLGNVPNFGVMVVSVAIIAYVLDSYPTASGEVSACINLGRVCSGFSVGYFQQAWGAAQGYSLSFGLQAVVIAASLVLLVLIQLFGARLRRWAGPVKIGLE